MMDAAPRDASHEAVAALERLYAKQVITLEEGQAAARFITGDAGFAFPPQKAPAAAGDPSDGAPTDRPSG